MRRGFLFFLAMTALSFLGMAANFLILAYNWETLPEFFSVGAGFIGVPEIYVGKWFFLLVPIGSAIIYVLFSIMFFRPRSFQSYPYKITPGSRERHYSVIRAFSLVLQTELIWTLTFFELWAVDFILRCELIPTVLFVCMIPVMILSSALMLKRGKKIPR